MSKIVSVFGSGVLKPGSRAWQEAFLAGELLAKAGYVVMNGGYGGSMTASAEGAKRAGGKTIGITTRDFGPSKANSWIDREKRMTHWQDRMIYLVKNSDAAVALPGRLGTLIEIAVSLEMMRKNLIPLRPFVIVGTEWKRIFFRYLKREAQNIRAYFYFVSRVKDVPRILHETL